MPCRARKVRCIVTGSFQPCMNCKLDEKDCDFARGAKIYPKYPRSRLVAAAPKTPDTQSETSSHECPPPSRQAQSPVGSDASGNNQLDQRCSNNALPSQLCQASSTANSLGPDISGLLYDPTDPAYAFLQTPKVKTILPQDLEFLYNQGCFVVPQRHVLDEFIHKYFSFIHPILPILNEADFWALYNQKTSPDTCYDRLSILVLQGVLFTSSTFLSEEAIKSLGFKTTQDAKYTFYRRAKLLYDFGYERSSIAIAQASVLLSHSHLIPLPYGGYKQLGSLWAGIAIHHARDARAHRYYLIPPSSLQTPEQIKHYNVLKRLWWCCVICDRVVPLTSRQNIKITRTNFNFDDSPILSVDDLSDEFEYSNVYDSSTKALLAQALVKIVELCVVLTDVLSLSSLVHENPNLALSQKFSETNPAGMCRVQLQRWYNSFLEWKCTVNRKTMQDAVDKTPGGSVVLFTNLAEMYYHSARLTLCHYEMLHLGQAASSMNPILDISDMFQKSYELQNAISQVTECLTELTRLGLIRWLPMSAVGCTALPLALQILDAELLQVKFSDLSQSKGSSLIPGHRQERLNVLIEAMRTYRPKYFIVDWVAQTVRHIVNVAQKCLPASGVKSGDSGLSIASWIEILQMQPNCYLRLALTMDLSISNGKLPEETDFPPGLRHMLHGRINVSPEFLPFTLANQSGGPTSKTQTTQEQAAEENSSLTQNPCAASTPELNSDGNLDQGGLLRRNDEAANLDAVFGGISSCPDMLSTLNFPGMDSSWGTMNSGTLIGDSLGFKPDTMFSPFQFQTFNFDMGHGQAPSNGFQWDDGQSNNVEPDVQMDGSILDALRDATSSSLTANDSRLLDELEKVMNMS